MIGPLPYIGGKRRLAPQLAALIPPHITYVEPFAGGAQLFFHKPRSRVEVLNDYDTEIVNFLRVCQRHAEELIRTLEWQPVSRWLFEAHDRQPPENLTDIERAARFFYLQKNAWAGSRRQRSFHYGVIKVAGHIPASLRRRLSDTAARLAGVQLERASYETVLKRYDRPTTFFYCDPPYVDISLYVHNLADAQFTALAEQLAALKGAFLLSINDCAKSRQWFGQFHCRPISLTYTALTRPRQVTELLFANYPLNPP